MQLQNKSYGPFNDRQYEDFVLWFKENYPNFYELYVNYLQPSPEAGIAAVIYRHENLLEEEAEFLESIIRLYNSSKLKH